MSVSAPARSTISAFIVCCNEEKQIRRCLASVAWCDEVVVVDSGSKDSTLAICNEFTNKIFHRPWSGYVEQKRHALSLCSSTWILNLDADEEVSPELRDEILGVLERDAVKSDDINGYHLSRVVYYLHRWWRKGGWYPEYRLRLCRRSTTSWGGEDPHEKAIVSGNTTRMTGELRHYTYEDIAYQVGRVNTLSSNAAVTLDRKGKRASIADIIVRPLIRFVKFYFFKGGYREGVAGFIVAWLEATQVLLKYSKLWEYSVKKNRIAKGLPGTDPAVQDVRSRSS